MTDQRPTKPGPEALPTRTRPHEERVMQDLRNKAMAPLDNRAMAPKDMK